MEIRYKNPLLDIIADADPDMHPEVLWHQAEELVNTIETMMMMMSDQIGIEFKNAEELRQAGDRIQSVLLEELEIIKYP